MSPLFTLMTVNLGYVFDGLTFYIVFSFLLLRGAVVMNVDTLIHCLGFSQYLLLRSSITSETSSSRSKFSS